MNVYKYVKPERIDDLENARIRFTQLAALNDPFESMPRFGEYKKFLFETVHHKAQERFGVEAAQETVAERAKLTEQSILKIPEMFSKYFVLLSLSKVRNNLLMWSHYTDSHKGFVIGFDSLSPFFQPGKGKGVDGLKEVYYSRNRYRVPAGGFKSLDDPNLHRGNVGMFFTKSSMWRYENELRILAHPKSANVTITKLGEYDICLFDFPADSVKQIIMGYRISPELRERIVQVKNHKYYNAKLFRAVLDDTKFKLRIEPFSV